MINQEIIDKSNKVIKDSLATGTGQLLESIPLFKFRPLDSAENFERLMKIIETGKLWCSKVSELNDPMEGAFSIDVSHVSDDDFQKSFSAWGPIRNELNRYTLCALSSPTALTTPLTWSQYSGGFRGLALEIQVENLTNLYPIDYQMDKRLDTWREPQKAALDSIRKKHPEWSYESEIRYIIDSNGIAGPLLDIRILAAYIPLGVSMYFRDHAHQSRVWAEFYWRLKHIVNQMKSLNIPMYRLNLRFEHGMRYKLWTEDDDQLLNELAP